MLEINKHSDINIKYEVIKRGRVPYEIAKKCKKMRKELKVKSIKSIIKDIATTYSNIMFKTQLYLPNSANEMLDKLQLIAGK